MRCVTCSTEIESSMKHAISINSCPFCGRNIFSADEYEFRKSVQRILIKNGLEDEQMMTGIVDDITTILGEQYTRDKGAKQDPRQVDQNVESQFAQGPDGKTYAVGKAIVNTTVQPQKPQAPQRRVASQEEIEEAMAAEEEAAGNPNLAPARQLAPDPRRTTAPQKPLTHADKVALAMREFEASQRIDDDNITHAQDGAEYIDHDESDDQEIFTIDRAPSSEVERRKQLAAERIRQVQEKSGFKNQPIQRRP